MQRWILASVLAALCTLQAGTAGAAGKAKVAILPVVVHSTDSHDFLRAGLSDMLASRLGQVKDITVVRIDDAQKATSDLQAAQATARELGADWVLFGSFTRFGDGASLDIECAAVSGDPAASQMFVQAGTLGEIIPKLDDVSQRVAMFVESGGTGTAAVSAPPPRAADVSRTEVDDLRRRVEALERSQRSATPPAASAAKPSASTE